MLQIIAARASKTLSTSAASRPTSNTVSDALNHSVVALNGTLNHTSDGCFCCRGRKRGRKERRMRWYLSVRGLGSTATTEMHRHVGCPRPPTPRFWKEYDARSGAGA
eukprot:1172975-Rhodomonas_salina.1